jgi:hypothetical protein
MKTTSAMSKFEYLEIQFGPIDLDYSPKSKELEALHRTIVSQALPFGGYYKQLEGARSIKVFKLAELQYNVKYANKLCFSYTKYFSTKEFSNDISSSLENRGYLRAVVYFVDETEFIKYISGDVNWVAKLIEYLVDNSVNKAKLRWLLQDVKTYKIPTSSKLHLQLPSKTLVYLKRGGVGLQRKYSNSQDWLYMEEVVRQLVLNYLQEENSILSFSTLSTSPSEFVNIFAIPDFNAVNIEIEIIESSKSYNEGIRIGRRWFNRIVGTIMFILLSVAILIFYASANTPTNMGTITPAFPPVITHSETSTLTFTPTFTSTSTPTPTFTPTPNPTTTTAQQPTISPVSTP